MIARRPLRISVIRLAGTERRPRRSQRSPRRPDVQRRDVAVPHVFLVNRVERDLLQGAGDFD